VEAATVSTAAVHDLDLELVERHRLGDPRAFDEIYRRFDHMVFGLALRLSGSEDQAADLTQEIFLRVFRYIGQFRGRSSLKTWVFRIAINHCRSCLGRRRLPVQPLPDGAEGAEADRGPGALADPARGPEDLAVAADEGRRVAAGLATLPAAFREAVVLRDIEGLSYEEIAEVLGVRIGTVRSRIARGRDQLRTFLEGA
jgi:RNA polymerase sigma-70 factor (ECF subfamily)